MAEGNARAPRRLRHARSTTRRATSTPLLLLRLLCEIAAIVLGHALALRTSTTATWLAVAAHVDRRDAGGVVRGRSGVAPRTLGPPARRARSRWPSAAPRRALTRVLGPLPRLLILLGNAITPGKGFREGPFSTETELRELVDLAEASGVIESGERKMIHSVFELGDTIVARGDGAAHRRRLHRAHKNLRQTMSLFLRSGFSRVPVVDDNLDDIVGFAYLKDIVAPRLRGAATRSSPSASTTVMRPAHLRARLQAGRRAAPRDAGRTARTSRSSSTSTAAPPAWSPSRTCSRRSSARSPTSTTQARSTVEQLDDGSSGSPPRYPIDDLDELFGVDVDDDDVDTVGGLMAKHLGKVPIPGARSVEGLRLLSRPSGRRPPQPDRDGAGPTRRADRPAADGSQQTADR